MNTQKGFSLVEMLVIAGVLVLVAGLGFVGWKSFNNSTKPETTAVSNSATIEVITSEKDLEAAEKQLDKLNFEDDSSAEAEAQASF